MYEPVNRTGFNSGERERVRPIPGTRDERSPGLVLSLRQSSSSFARSSLLLLLLYLNCAPAANCLRGGKQQLLPYTHTHTWCQYSKRWQRETGTSSGLCSARCLLCAVCVCPHFSPSLFHHRPLILLNLASSSDTIADTKPLRAKLEEEEKTSSLSQLTLATEVHDQTSCSPFRLSHFFFAARPRIERIESRRG